MVSAEKVKPLTKFQIMKLSLRYFGILSKKRTEVIAIILLATLFKNYLKHESDLIIKKLKKMEYATATEVKKGCLQLSTYAVINMGSNFVTDFVFDKKLLQYGGHIAIKVLEKILFTESNIGFEVQGSQLEYFMSEGGKSMAKISRAMIFNLPSKMLHLIFDIKYIITVDQSFYKAVSLSFLVALMILVSIKAWTVPRVAAANKLTMVVAYEKEKSINETLENIAIIKSANTSKHSVTRYARKAFYWELTNLDYKFWSLSTDMLFNLVSSAVRPGAALLYLIFCNNGWYHDSVLNSTISEYMSAISEMLKTATGLVTFHTDLMNTFAMTDQVIEYLRLSREEADKAIRVNTFSDSIEVKSLTYVCKDKVIFNDASFTLRKGDKAVVIGRNGMGKSSLFKVILGFDDYKGTVLFDGIDMHRLCMRDFRGLVAYVPQDTKLFDESIYYNLTFANNKPFEEVIEMCQKMKIHDAIMGLPAGYNTMVGESGKCINGGLKQKIFYTRAMLQDAEIYMFDEPTNNLDAQHSRFLEELIVDKEYESKTFLVICHDKEIAEKFPKKLKLEDGRIWEIDTV